MSESFDSIESFEIPNIINDFFNTVARISNNSNTIFQTLTLDIIDESSNTLKSIWDYFNKVKENNKVIAKCKYCKNAKYSVTNGAATNLWGHLKRMYNSLLGVSTSQSTLDKFSTKHIESKNISNEFRQWMAEWIIFKDLLFTIIERHFKSMIKRALKIKVVSADTIQCNILQKYSQIHDNIHQELQASSKLAFTLDIWTSILVKAYIGITIYFIDKSWSFQQRILNFVELEGAHSGKNIANEFIKMVEFYNIETK
ncbi:35604_t:CDS:2, partial [Gigaspora margarita]